MPYLQVSINPPFRDIRGRFTRATDAMRAEARNQMRGMGKRWRELVAQEAPRRTGKFISKHIYRTSDYGNTVELRAYTPQPLSGWIMDGTGIYGPAGRRIYPKHAKALKFLWESGPKSSSGFTAFHFYKSVAGMRPNKYLDRVNQAFKPELNLAARRIALRFVETWAR